MSNLNFYNMRRLLSFLCLFVIGWGSAWAGTFRTNNSSGIVPGTEMNAGRHLKMTVSVNGYTLNSNGSYIYGQGPAFDSQTKVPTGGLFFKFVPDYDGTMSVNYQIHATDKITYAYEYDAQTGNCLEVASLQSANDAWVNLNFNVSAGKTYYVYAPGTNQSHYSSVTYKINITDFRCREGNEVNWGGNQSSSQTTADWVVRVNGVNGSETPTELVNYSYPYNGNPGGAYNSTANNRFIEYSQSPSGIIRIDDMWHRFSGTHYYANWQGIVPGSVTELTAYFPGNDDYNPATATKNFFVHKGWQGLEYAKKTDTYAFDWNLSINQVELTKSWIHQTITYTSSNPAVATVNSNGVVTWTGQAGSTVITASVPGSNEWSAASSSYTLTINGNAGPRIVWVTAFPGWEAEGANKPAAEELPIHANNLVNKKEGLARGLLKTVRGAEPYASGYFGPMHVFNTTAGKEVVYRTDNIFTSYGQKVYVNAYALAPNAQIPSWWKRMPTDNNNPDRECYYYIIQDGSTHPDPNVTTLTLKNESGQITSYNVQDAERWRAYKDAWRPIYDTNASNLFYNGDPTNAAITYSNSANFEGSQTISTQYGGDGHNDYGGGSKYYQLNMGTLLSDSLEIYATVVPTNRWENVSRSTIKVAVFGGFLQMSFEPKEVVVNQGNWIKPYLKFPDTPMGDFEKIYVTIDNGTIVDVVSMDQLFVNTQGENIKNLSTDQINAICGEYIEWKWSYKTDANGNKIEGSDYPVITGVRPKIYGLIAGQETDVRVHIVSSKWTDTGASVHVKVIAQGGDLFHFEMNDVNGHDVASMNDIGNIFMFEGDYIYMPGIIGNPNGNDDYSVPYTYKYLYAIQGDGDGVRRIVLNRDGYFQGEGVANYFIAETDNGVPLIPTNDMKADDCNQKVLIFKEVGLGNYYRNDSLMLYGHKPGTMYLYAEDAQTGWRCKPLRIHVIPREGTGQEYGKASLMAQKQEMMKNMSYPFTWDFEHMDMSKIYQDASWAQSSESGGGQKVAGGNGSSYWRKRWDYTERGSKVRDPQYKKWYQWNGVFNADHDDKDGNGRTSGTVTVDGNTAQSGMRQRWFKDITANGEYLSLFKGLMISIAGLDYWQQKYTRFNVAEDGTKILFEGGVHFMSLPGFGATGNVGETYTTVDPTRPAGTVRMPHLHNQMNTNDNVTFESDFGTNFTGSGYTATLTDEQKRNNKVKFVIKARGGSNPVSDTKAGGVIYVGGKSMISTVVNDNGVRFSEHTDYDPSTQQPISGIRIPLFEDEEPKIFVVELDPWDPEYQEQIYLAMDGTVEIYWMGITTEPRNMRSDYNVFTYSYPKDIDMDKTNQVMKLLTNDIVYSEGNQQKHGVELKTYYGDAFGGDKMTVMPIADYSENPANYKFGAYEGVFVYPSVDLNQLRSQNKFTQALLNPDPTVPGNVKYHWQTGEQLPVNSGVMDVTSTTTAVTIDLTEKKDNNGNTVYEDGQPVYVAKTDPKGHYAYKQTSQEYTYSYLPVYFVANAENQDNYNANNPSVQDNIKRGREHTMDAIKLTSDGYDHWVDMPATPQKYTDGLWYNQRRNKLNGNPFSRWQPQDYVSQTDSIDVNKYTNFTTEGSYNGKEEWGEKEIEVDGEKVMAPRWITLTMTNKFMIRYLKYENNEQQEKVLTKVLDEFLKDASGNVVSAVGSTGTGDPEFYYNLVGPSCVRFYRTFVPNYPKGRRASLSLTWDQYNVNTFGKEGMFWNLDGNGRYANFPWVDYEKAKPLGQPTGGTDAAGNPVVPNGAKQGLQMVFLLAGDGESMVSEDGGFPDSINGVTESIEGTGEGEFYNLNGVRVTTPRKGVYIYNGRKVVIK